MTKTFEVPFRGCPNAVYKIKVTDKQEPRDGWKRAVAINKATERFNREHCTGWTGTRYLIRSKVREI